MGKMFLENNISLRQYVFRRCSSMCLCWDLFSSYPIYSEQLQAFLFILSQFILTSTFPLCILAVGFVGGQAIRLLFFQPWNYLVSVHCIFLFFLLLMISYSHVTSVSKSFLAPWGLHLPLIMLLIMLIYFEYVLVMQASLQVFCRKLPLDIHSWKLLFHDNSNPSVASKEDEPSPKQ